MAKRRKKHGLKMRRKRRVSGIGGGDNLPLFIGAGVGAMAAGFIGGAIQKAVPKGWPAWTPAVAAIGLGFLGVAKLKQPILKGASLGLGAVGLASMGQEFIPGASVSGLGDWHRLSGFQNFPNNPQLNTIGGFQNFPNNPQLNTISGISVNPNNIAPSVIAGGAAKLAACGIS